MLNRSSMLLRIYGEFLERRDNNYYNSIKQGRDGIVVTKLSDGEKTDYTRSLMGC